MGRYEFDEILRKYLAGKCTSEEEKIVLQWYETFKQQSEVELSADQKQLLEQQIWLKIDSGTNNFIGSGKIKWIHSHWVRVASAACLIGIVIASALWYFNRPTESKITSFTDIRVPQGYKQIYNEHSLVHIVPLNDGSVIELQPQSSLYYPEQFEGTTRNVFLTGSAFFKVAHDTSRHFIVHTEEGLVTEVLGTSFYVLHDKETNKVEVAVITGKVSVYEEKTKDGNKPVTENKIILTPNQKVSFKPVNSQFITSLVEDPKPAEQPAGQPEMHFVFEEDPLSKVVELLEASYGITIQMENESLGNCHFTGDITHKNLYEKLDILCRSTQSSYEVRGTLIYLKGKGCN